MKKLSFALLLAFIFVSNLFAEQIIILHTNDHHGRPLPFDYKGTVIGGLPARATIVDSVRKHNENVLLLDCGDINDGLIESNLFDAEPDIKGYNYLKYDAMTLGNHEFYKSFEKLEKQKDMATFPFLCANIFKKDNTYLAKPYVIIEKSSYKIGIIGLTTNSTQYSAPLSISSQLLFYDEVEIAQNIINAIKDSTDFIIALTHLGISDKPDYGAINLAKKIHGLNLIIDGHSHTYLDKPIWVKNSLSQDSVAVVQANCWGTHIGYAVIEINNDIKKLVSWEAIPIVHNDKDDEFLISELLPFVYEAESIMGQVVGKSDKHYSSDEVRLKENELAQLSVDAMQWYFKDYKPDFCVTNGGGVRHFLNSGDIKKSDIYNIYPFDNHLSLVEISGNDIIKIIEKFVSDKIGTGGYLHFSSGFYINVNSDKTIGEIRINNISIDANKNYKVVTNSYLAGGGDAYKEFLNGKKLPISTVFERDVVSEYIIQVLKGKIVLTAKPQLHYDLR
ncbi:MAG: 5'-nucleotidase C-terminal domain-containing protein [Candidatus Cloacimonadales bacterium]|jgi:5'-nucleotidase/UDP-sugar diphosphatase|nr:5'-nucleotidase C-terminal domain-containing protein [Candidatus Cloacimonadota bacterium]MDX9977154.1 5'-nucleotidase C-terminal domain-containing protein [Candidatus Cloacimonadales bacterium]HPY97050.1 5'-nucleotidase C-terminal domain-containing protein [Candidatus Cloacimonadota bacterium]